MIRCFRFQTRNHCFMSQCQTNHQLCSKVWTQAWWEHIVLRNYKTLFTLMILNKLLINWMLWDCRRGHHHSKASSWEHCFLMSWEWDLKNLLFLQIGSLIWIFCMYKKMYVTTSFMRLKVCICVQWVDNWVDFSHDSIWKLLSVKLLHFLI